jgi:hypothetical protein
MKGKLFFGILTVLFFLVPAASAQFIDPTDGVDYSDVFNDMINNNQRQNNAPQTTLTATINTNPSNTGNAPFTVSFSATVTGGSGNYTYEWDFTDNGSWDSTSATPSFTYSADSTVRLRVTDSNGNIGIDTETIDVNFVAPRFITNSCPDGEVDVAYTCDIDATGIGTITYSLLNSPNGMSINSTNGIVSWTPSDDGLFSFTVRATDSIGSFDRTFDVRINSNEPEADDLFLESVKLVDDSLNAGSQVNGRVVLENKGDNDFIDLIVTMSIDELGLTTSLNKFDLNNGEKKTKDLVLQLPTDVNSGHYFVKFTVTNVDVSAKRYVDLTVNGNSVTVVTTTGNVPIKTSKEFAVEVKPSISSYQPPVDQSARVNWKGIVGLIFILGLLVTIAVYLFREVKTNAKEEVSITALDDDQI